MIFEMFIRKKDISMRKKIYVFGFLVALFVFQSCVLNHDGEASVADLKLKLDSLENLKANLENEVNGYFASIEEIEQNISRVKELEGFISLESFNDEIENPAKDISEQVLLIVNILEKNQKEVERLRKKLDNSSLKISRLEKTLLRLAKENRKQLESIEKLNQELQKKNELILQQEVEIKGLSSDVQLLAEENLEKQQIIQRQDQEIHMAWYVFGTYKELKKQQILSSNGWFSAPSVMENSLNKDYFIQIDVRTTTEIPLYSDKAKIRTTHAKSSYELKKDKGGLLVLYINNPKEFWAVSRFLVVEID